MCKNVFGCYYDDDCCKTAWLQLEGQSYITTYNNKQVLIIRY